MKKWNSKLLCASLGLLCSLPLFALEREAAATFPTPDQVIQAIVHAADAQGGEVEYVFDGKMIGGFALVAWPFEYGVSGIKTFMVNHEGIVYEKDLGANTAILASRILRFDPENSWRKVMD